MMPSARWCRRSRTYDRNAILSVLGNAGEWISSGDATADKTTVARFLSEYEEKHTIVPDGDKATLTIGSDDFPFAFPLVTSGERWRFDTASRKGRTARAAHRRQRARRDQGTAGNRRCGTGIRFRGPCTAMASSRTRRGFASRPGKRDGLYWPDESR